MCACVCLCMQYSCVFGPVCCAVHGSLSVPNGPLGPMDRGKLLLRPRTCIDTHANTRTCTHAHLPPPAKHMRAHTHTHTHTQPYLLPYSAWQVQRVTHRDKDRQIRERLGADAMGCAKLDTQHPACGHGIAMSQPSSHMRDAISMLPYTCCLPRACAARHEQHVLTHRLGSFAGVLFKGK